MFDIILLMNANHLYTVECFAMFCFVVKTSADKMISQFFDIFLHDFSLFFNIILTLFRPKISIGLKKALGNIPLHCALGRKKEKQGTLRYETFHLLHMLRKVNVLLTIAECIPEYKDT